MEITPNYGFHIPDGDDYYNIDDYKFNIEKTDDEFTRIDGRLDDMALDNVVLKTDIVNDLTTDDPTKPLSAAMGAKLEMEKANAFKTRSFNIFVSPQGDNVTGDGTELSPYKTINYALSTIPKLTNGGTSTITLAPGTYDEEVRLQGFCNASFYNGIVLKGSDTLSGADGYKIRAFVVYSNNGEIRIEGISVYGAYTAQGITVSNSCLDVVKCKISGSKVRGIFCRKSSSVVVNSCEVSNNSEVAIMAHDNSVVSVNNTTGTNNAVGLRAGSNSSATGGIIFKASTINLGATVAEEKVRGGQIF